MQTNTTLAVGIGIAIGSLSFAALAGPDWIEDGDAGSSIGGAQDTRSVGFLNTVAGTLGGIDQVDVYQLNIQDSDEFATLVDFGFTFNGGPEFNPALWLFDSQGYGVLGNDDDPIFGGPGARLTTPSTDGVTLLLAPGTYFLAICESGNEPLSFREGLFPGKGGFEEIFSFADSLEVSGPDGLGADNPLAGWSGGAGTGGTYGIAVTPAPSSVALISLSGLALGRRRRI